MRVTVDLDKPTMLEVERAWSILSNYGDGNVHGRVSSSGRGVHLKVHGFDGDLRDTITPRAHAGDDPDRIFFDEKWEVKPKQILFGSKPELGNHAGEWRDTIDHLLADYRVRSPRQDRFDLPSRLQPQG